MMILRPLSVNRSNILPPLDGVYERNCESKPFEKSSLILTRLHPSVKDTRELDSTDHSCHRNVDFWGSQNGSVH